MKHIQKLLNLINSHKIQNILFYEDRKLSEQQINHLLKINQNLKIYIAINSIFSQKRLLGKFRNNQRIFISDLTSIQNINYDYIFFGIIDNKINSIINSINYKCVIEFDGNIPYRSFNFQKFKLGQFNLFYNFQNIIEQKNQIQKLTQQFGTINLITGQQNKKENINKNPYILYSNNDNINISDQKKYSILTFIIEDYQPVREIDQKDSLCEYILVTDNPNLKSNTWKIIYDQTLTKIKGTFNKCYAIRYNIFKYCTTNICISIDGSIHIKKSLRALYNKFIQQNYDIALMPHPSRYNLIDQINQWERFRHYKNKEKFIKFLNDSKYDINYKGFFQIGLRIIKNTKINSDIDKMTLSLISYLGNEDDGERIDQLVYSYIINRYFNNLNILPLSQQIIQSQNLMICKHNKNSQYGILNINYDEKYIFNKLTICYLLKYNNKNYKIPVFIRTRNRLGYLIHTLRSLQALPDYDKLDITIYDDHSDDEKMIQFLTTNNFINFYYDFGKAFGENQLLNKKVKQHLILPIINGIVGIKDKYKVYICDHCYGDKSGALNMIKTGFQIYKNTPYIIFLQGDILFNKNWLNSFLNVYQFQKDNCGLISNFILSKPIPIYNQYQKYYIVKYITFPSILVTKSVYNCLLQNNEFQKKYLPYDDVKDKSLLISKSEYNIAGDSYISDFVCTHDLKVIQLKQSFVEHIGMKSSCRPFNEKIFFASNFKFPFTYQLNQFKRILIFSNINFPKQNTQLLNINQNQDLLIFMNSAVPLKYFKNYKNFIIYKRYNEKGIYFESNYQKTNKCNVQYVDGPKSFLTNQQIKLIKQNYSKQFFKDEQVIKQNLIQEKHVFRWGPTTGWILQFILKLRYKNSKVQLVNFFPTTDNSTGHFKGHDWKFENEYYQNHKEIKIYDLRKK